MGHGGNVIDELMTDHREVEELFGRIEALPSGDKTRKVYADQATMELVRHSVAEEEYLYPAVREHLVNGNTMADREIEDHAGAEQIQALATSAGIPLETPGTATAGEEDRPPIPGLTARENEILRLVVAGHTYREIARALVISEKTVSAHISSMLRKTSTASRTELAQKYRRLTATAPAG